MFTYVYIYLILNVLVKKYLTNHFFLAYIYSSKSLYPQYIIKKYILKNELYFTLKLY